MTSALLVKSAGTSPEAHRASLDRVVQAGGLPVHANVPTAVITSAQMPWRRASRESP